MVERTPALQRRSHAKHAAIVQAAAELVGDIGYSATTIEKIAAHAGVGKQTIYRWWPSRAALFVETYTSLVEGVPAPTGGRHGKRNLTRFLTALFNNYRRTHAGWILQGLLGDMATDPVAREAIRQGLIPRRAGVLRDAIAAGMAAGDIGDTLTPDEVANTLVALVWQQLLLNPEQLDARFARQAVRVATAGD